MVVVPRHVSEVVAQGGLHVIVGAAVLDRCVADLLLPTYVVIGVEAVGSIAHCQIELHDMARHRLGIIASVAAVAACLEACAVVQRGECAVVPVVERPVVLQGDCGSGIDQVEAIVAVEPCAAAFDEVSGASRKRRVHAETVDISIGEGIESTVVIGIDVVYQVVAARNQVPADRLAVVDRQILEQVAVAAVNAECFGLGQAVCNGDPHTHHLESAKDAVVAGHPECGHAQAGGRHRRDVEHRPLVGDVDIGDAGLGDLIDHGVGLPHHADVGAGQAIGAAAQVDGIASGRGGLRGHHAGKGGGESAGIAVVAGGLDVPVSGHGGAGWHAGGNGDRHDGAEREIHRMSLV